MMMMRNKVGILQRSLLLLGVLVLVVLHNNNFGVDAAMVRLADCPTEPNVIGVYYNNGKKCVRERQELERTIVDATCPDGYELRGIKCRPIDSSNGMIRKGSTKTPMCPEEYQRYGTSCHGPCPDGFNAKRGSCIQLRDVLPQHSMTCPSSNDTTTTTTTEEPLHLVGPYCCRQDQCTVLAREQEQERSASTIGGNSNDVRLRKPSLGRPRPLSSLSWVQCNVEEIPGIFYHNPDRQRCERSMTSEPRLWTKLPSRDNNNNSSNETFCEPGQEKILGGCQDKCPTGYKAKKGMCQLRPCDFATGDTLVECPEGKYQLRAKNL